MTDKNLRPDPTLVDRFRADLQPLVGADARIGVAVSGGADSLALLLLAAAARPGAVKAVTVDHRLRDESRDEAAMVADVCQRLGVRHQVLNVEWEQKPATAIQEQARVARYKLLARWALERRVEAVLTAHHADDQAETFLMRLARGAGVRGLAAIRPSVRLPGSDIRLLRPLLGWRRSELEQICAAAGLTPAADPSNADEQFERVRVRRALAQLEGLDSAAIARSAANLAAADAALDWSVKQIWYRLVTRLEGEVLFRAHPDIPAEIQRRIVHRAVLELATEGEPELRGQELDRLLETLWAGGRATLRGVLCSGGKPWRFIPAPNRTRRNRTAR